MPNSLIIIRLRHSPGFTAWSHGWAYLAPFTEDGDYLRWAALLPDAGARDVSLRWSDESNTVRVGIPGEKIGETDRQFIRGQVRWMFRADEDFSEFWGSVPGPRRLASMQVDADRRAVALPDGFRGRGQDDLYDQCPLAEHQADGREPVPDVRRAVPRRQ